MKKYFYILLILFLIATGCSRRENAAIAIGEITVTSSEFEEAFQSSRFAHQRQAGRRLFLDTLVSKKLILKEAEEMGLDKDPEFLKDIQAFWEQGLLKLVLSQKSKEFSTMIKVSDVEIKEYYRDRKESDFATQELPEVYDQIKWLLLQNKQAQAMSQWVDSLRAKTTVIVDRSLLGIKD